MIRKLSFYSTTYIFLQQSLFYQDIKGGEGVEVTPIDFKKHVMQALSTIFGEIGTSIEVDVLKYDPATHKAILRCPSSAYVKLHGALTLTSNFQGLDCVYKVHKTSPTLISLIADSRSYEHC